MRRLAVIAALVTALATVASPAVAAPPPQGGSVSGLGVDVSWPQCGSALPSGQAFGVVGVNGGLATTTNPCLTDQLRWAAGSAGGTSQSKVQLYVNTGNPGGLGTASWPGASTAWTPYGYCDGGDTLSCAWEYGRERAQEDADTRLAPAATAAGLSSFTPDYTWWLDVELENTWKASGSAADQASNRAVLEGMASYFASRGARVGVYSTATQWSVIAGTVPKTSSLAGLDSWRAGGLSQRSAQRGCSAAPLIPGGRVVLSQYVEGGIDKNISCTG